VHHPPPPPPPPLPPPPRRRTITRTAVGRRPKGEGDAWPSVASKAGSRRRRSSLARGPSRWARCGPSPTSAFCPRLTPPRTPPPWPSAALGSTSPAPQLPLQRLQRHRQGPRQIPAQVLHVVVHVDLAVNEGFGPELCVAVLQFRRTKSLRAADPGERAGRTKARAALYMANGGPWGYTWRSKSSQE